MRDSREEVREGSKEEVREDIEGWVIEGRGCFIGDGRERV